MLFRRELVMFGPREVLLTSDEPVVEQFLNGRRHGPIGMSEEKDQSVVDAELAALGTGERLPLPAQLEPTPGLPVRDAVRRRRERVLGNLHTLPRRAQEGVLAGLRASADHEAEPGARQGAGR
jgi:phospholipid/cholesterol/gamma-HCH transport system ATP-binding protein